MHARFYWRSICFLHFLRSQSLFFGLINSLADLRRVQWCPATTEDSTITTAIHSSEMISCVCWFICYAWNKDDSVWISSRVNYRPKKERSLLALLQFNNRAKRLLNGVWLGDFFHILSSGMCCSTFLRLLLASSIFFSPHFSHISHFLHYSTLLNALFPLSPTATERKLIVET